MSKLTDTSTMPNGKYKGVRMVDIPAFHLIWIYENNRCTKEVKEYIKDNLDVLKSESENRTS